MRTCSRVFIVLLLWIIAADNPRLYANDQIEILKKHVTSNLAADWPGEEAVCRPVPLKDVTVSGFLGERIDRNLDPVLAAIGCFDGCVICLVDAGRQEPHIFVCQVFNSHPDRLNIPGIEADTKNLYRLQSGGHSTCHLYPILLLCMKTIVRWIDLSRQSQITGLSDRERTCKTGDEQDDDCVDGCCAQLPASLNHRSSDPRRRSRFHPCPPAPPRPAAPRAGRP